MASFVSISAPPLYSRTRYLSGSGSGSGSGSAPHSPSLNQYRFKRVPVRCSSGPTPRDATEPPEVGTPSSSTSTPTQSSISTYNWCTGLGAVGFLETGYLTYLKLSGSDAFCPIGGGTCSDVLNSDYAYVFGVPLPLFGMLTYGAVASLGLLLARKSLPFGLDETNGRLILLGTTTTLAAASAYFVYLLSVQFAGTSCSYCYISAALSFTMFLITVKDFGLQEIQNVVGLQLFIAGLVVAALNTSYSAYQPVSNSLADFRQPYYETEIVEKSSPYAVSLAKHLHSIGAKMYGAFWCSHCLEQKQMFGQEAAKILDYVECFPHGFEKGSMMEMECTLARIEGFPTWVINGQVISGEQTLSELARVSGFVEESSSN